MGVARHNLGTHFYGGLAQKKCEPTRRAPAYVAVGVPTKKGYPTNNGAHHGWQDYSLLHGFLRLMRVQSHLIPIPTLPATPQRLIQIHRCHQPGQPQLHQLVTGLEQGALGIQQGH